MRPIARSPHHLFFRFVTTFSIPQASGLIAGSKVPRFVTLMTPHFFSDYAPRASSLTKVRTLAPSYVWIM